MPGEIFHIKRMKIGLCHGLLLNPPLFHAKERKLCILNTKYICGKYTNLVLKGCDQMPVFLDDTAQKAWKHADVVLVVFFYMYSSDENSVIWSDFRIICSSGEIKFVGVKYKDSECFREIIICTNNK